jgi:signal transduction histidine kinase
LILGLRPPELERDGLAGALRKEIAMLERVHGVPIELSVAGDLDGSVERRQLVLRIALEALHNALRHSNPSQVAVSLAAGDDGTMSVAVTDDGTGFEPARPELRARHLGLTSMEERARELGGEFSIRSRPGAGTTVRLEVPAR